MALQVGLGAETLHTQEAFAVQCLARVSRCDVYVELSGGGIPLTAVRAGVGLDSRVCTHVFS